MIIIVTALYHFLSLVVPFGKKLHSLRKRERPILDEQKCRVA